MAYPQWKRALKMVELMKQIEGEGKIIIENRNYIQLKIEREFDWCHGCLLLAVYGFYKNGYIKGTKPQKKANIDYTGFDGYSSLDIQHAFDALNLLKSNPNLTTSEIKRKLGGEASIYTFVRYFHNNGLLK